MNNDVERAAEAMRATLAEALVHVVNSCRQGATHGHVLVSGGHVEWELTEVDASMHQFWLECDYVPTPLATLGIDSFGSEALVDQDDSKSAANLARSATWSLATVELKGGIGVAVDEYLATAAVRLGDGTAKNVERGNEEALLDVGVSRTTLDAIRAWWEVL